MKLLKISFVWVRISIVGLIIMFSVIIVSRQPQIERLVRKIMVATSFTTAKKEWVLELDNKYTLCGHTETIRRIYPSLKRLQAAIQDYRGYQLKRKKGYLFVYATTIDGYCSGCQQNNFLGIRDQNIVVIRGTPEKPGPIVERIAIEFKNLPKLEQKDLQKGIPFSNSKEKLQLIEGLKGLSAN